MNLSTSRSVGNFMGLQRQGSQLNQQAGYSLRKSHTTGHCVIVSKRGFKPSDRFDPHKREFLTTLTNKLLHISLVRTARSGHQRARSRYHSAPSLVPSFIFSICR
ncbi:uncharacterized protein LOC134533095 [Bacillus rossius redtenbacheri]|uniref:uncharacterized protein LOC134533095 n=1 Tax=Bacillus rossius redtenbacheri TaxID=93214 RepID=UPI002FDDA4CB